MILVLLIVIYRSPLLALIPLVVAGMVYGGVGQLLGLLGRGGLVISKQTVSIMSILLFAVITDYSLFIFSRYREELKRYENKWEAMKQAMREAGLPVLFSGGTVLAAMLVLFFAKLGDYRNFAPTFALAMAVIMIASVTLIPALFTLFGRKAFWPNIPRVGENKARRRRTFWETVARFVVAKPRLTVAVIGALLVVLQHHARIALPRRVANPFRQRGGRASGRPYWRRHFFGRSHFGGDVCRADDSACATVVYVWISRRHWHFA